MSNLNFNFESPEEQHQEFRAEAEAVRVLADEPPKPPPNPYEDAVVSAVLFLNNVERDMKKVPGYPLERIVHAQDWLCKELPEWMHDILREW